MRHFIKILFFLALAAELSGAGRKEKSRDYRSGNLKKQINIEKKHYQNGLQGAAVCTASGEDIVEIRIYIKTGSVWEKDFYGSGISHFLEHLTAEGPTEKKTKKEVDLLMEKFGNRFNAYTSKDHTCYHITTTKRFYPEALKLLSEMVFENKITEEAFKRERGVIQREIEKSLEEPGRYLYRIASENLYRVHPAKYPVIGYRDLFEKITLEDIKYYYNKNYRPANALLFVGGNLPAGEVFKNIEDAASGYLRGFSDKPVLPEEPSLVSIRERKEFREIEGGYIDISWLTVPIDHEDLYALDLLSEILSSGRNSRLVKTIKEEKRLVNSIDSYSYTPAYGKGTFTVQSRFKDTDPGLVKKSIFEIINSVKKDGVTKEELERAKKMARSDYLFSQTSVSGVTAQAGIDILSTFDGDFSSVYLNNLSSVSSGEIQKVAEKYLSFSRYAVSALLSEEYLTEAAKEEILEVSRPEKFILDNGITVILKTMPGISVVNYDFFFKGGVTYNKIYDTPGLFDFYASLLARGTKKHRRISLNEKFEERGASFGVSSGNNTFYIKASSLASDTSYILGLLKEIVTEPAFDEEEFKKLKMFTLQAIAQQKNNWQEEAMLNYRKHIFPETMPYRVSELGTAESIEKIDRDMLHKVHGDFAVPSNMVISVAGDFKADEMKEKLQKIFGGIKDSKEDIGDYEKDILNIEGPVRKDYNTDKDMAVIFKGYPTVTVDDLRTRVVMDLIDTIISGGNYPGGWLHERLRARELVYVVHAYNMNYLKSGAFTIFAATNKEKTNKTLEVIDGVISDLKAGKYTDSDIRRAKDQIITSHKLHLQTPSAIAQNYALNEILGFGYDYDSEYLQAVEKVTADDIRETVDRYFTYPVTVITSPSR